MKLFRNSRFYILVSGIFLSVALWYLNMPGQEPRLAYVRISQIYGWVSIGFLYVALIITPLTTLLPEWRLGEALKHARRAIGVSAGYFAYLHTAVSTIYLLGGFSALLQFRGSYGWAIWSGLVALLVLMIMTVTSTDPAVRLLTFRRWKRLHRTVYLASIAIITHVLLIGSFKATNPLLVLMLISAVVVLINLEIGSIYLKRMGKK